jgi:glutamine synthetase
MDGIRRSLDPGEMQETPYSADVPMLPQNLSAALDALEPSAMFRETFGEQFISYWLQLRRSEWDRFVGAEGNVDMRSDAVTAWEHREYFELM